jgi:hypothetical protein
MENRSTGLFLFWWLRRFSIKGHSKIFDTPINLDGNRWNNHYTNLAWRPRWFAIKYNRQFREPFVYPILLPIEDVKSGEVTVTSFKTAKRYGLLESDVVLSIANRTYCWPTYQEFRIVNNTIKRRYILFTDDAQRAFEEMRDRPFKYR